MIRYLKLGDAEHVSPEFIRAWCWATQTVLGFHNMNHSRFGQSVRVSALEPGVSGLMTPYPNGRNTAITVPLIELSLHLNPEDMATTIVHEFIHAMCGDFGEGTDEKCTSTLTAKLKPEIQLLAKPLLDGTYRRAGIIAHTKMSYRNKSIRRVDYYDDAQDDPIGVTDKYVKRGLVE